jgi:antitoxin FitA
MVQMNITLSDDSARLLRQRASEADMTPEELVRATVEEWLRRSKDDFAAAAEYVLKKNAELYRRLS